MSDRKWVLVGAKRKQVREKVGRVISDAASGSQTAVARFTPGIEGNSKCGACNSRTKHKANCPNHPARRSTAPSLATSHLTLQQFLAPSALATGPPSPVEPPLVDSTPAVDPAPAVESLPSLSQSSATPFVLPNANDYLTDDDLPDEAGLEVTVKETSLLSEYLNLVVKKIKADLPPIRDNVLLKGAKPAALWWPFPAPVDLLKSSDQRLKAFSTTGVAHTLQAARIILIDPALTHPNWVQGRFRCNEVTQNGSACGNILNRDEYDTPLLIKSLGDWKITLSIRHRCMDCKAANGEHKTISRGFFESGIIEQCCLEYGLTLGLRKSNGVIFCTNLLAYVRTSRRSGIGFASISDSLRNAAEDHGLRLTGLFISFVSQYAALGLITAENVKGLVDEDPVYYGKLFVPSGRQLSNAFVDDMQSLEPAMQGVIRRNAKGSSSLAFDAFFPNKNSGSKHGATCGLNVVDGFGRVVGSSAVVSKSLNGSGVQKFLKSICEASKIDVNAESPVRVIFSDNAGKDRKAIHKVFPKATVALDLFHFLKPYYDTCKKASPMHGDWCRKFFAATIRFDEEDIQRHVEHLKARGAAPEDAERLTSSVFYLKRQPGIGRYLVSSEDFCLKADAIIADHAPLATFKKNGDIYKVHKDQSKKAPLVFDLPASIPQVMEYQTPNGQTKVIHMRGTNLVENLHRWMQGANTYLCGPESTHATFLVILFGRSQDISIELLGHQLVRSDNLLLKNIVYHMQEKLKQITSIEIHSINPSDVVSPINPDLYLVNYRRPLDSTLQAAAPILNQPLAKGKRAAAKRRQQTAAPFDPANPDEAKIVFPLIAQNVNAIFVWKDHWSLFNENGTLNRDLLTSLVASKGIDKILNKAQLSVIWNQTAVTAYTAESPFITLASNIRVPTDKVRPKEPVHFATLFERFEVARRIRCQSDASRALGIPVTTATPDVLRVVDIGFAPAAASQPPQLPPIQQVSPVVVPQHPIPQVDKDKDFVPCPACKKRIHKSGVSCPFINFMTVNGTTKRLGNETRLAAGRRIWALMTKEQQDAYIDS